MHTPSIEEFDGFVASPQEAMLLDLDLVSPIEADPYWETTVVAGETNEPPSLGLDLFDPAFDDAPEQAGPTGDQPALD